MTIETLHQKFIHELPGETAQERMSPQPKYVEGKRESTKVIPSTVPL